MLEAFYSREVYRGSWSIATGAAERTEEGFEVSRALSWWVKVDAAAMGYVFLVEGLLAPFLDSRHEISPHRQRSCRRGGVREPSPPGGARCGVPALHLLGPRGGYASRPRVIPCPCDAGSLKSWFGFTSARLRCCRSLSQRRLILCLGGAVARHWSYVVSRRSTVVL